MQLPVWIQFESNPTSPTKTPGSLHTSLLFLLQCPLLSAHDWSLGHLSRAALDLGEWCMCLISVLGPGPVQNVELMACAHQGEGYTRPAPSGCDSRGGQGILRGHSCAGVLNMRPPSSVFGEISSSRVEALNQRQPLSFSFLWLQHQDCWLASRGARSKRHQGEVKGPRDQHSHGLAIQLKAFVYLKQKQKHCRRPSSGV